MSSVLAVILGGGRGTRLYPLTKFRSKPAVPLGGKYRLIDITISNCLNSGYRKVFVLTQFQSASLNSHITSTYRFDPFAPGFVEILAAEQTDESQEWYQGTADSIRKHLHRLLEPAHDFYLILSGDHLYRMDYRDMVEQHASSGADVTVGVHAVTREAAKGLGIMRLAPDGRVVGFVEKPNDPRVLDELELNEGDLLPKGQQEQNQCFLGSMGIYVFSREALEKALVGTTKWDFGKHIIPSLLNQMRVMRYTFQGYWEDIGTIRAFYEANLRLTQHDSPFSFYAADAPIYTRPRYLAPTRVVNTRISDSLIADGCLLEEATVSNSILGIRSLVRRGSRIFRTIVMGRESFQGLGGIGQDCSIEGAILDLNAQIGDGVEIRGYPDRLDEDGEGYAVRDGIVVIPKNSTIPSGTKI